jgi:hypothetical protein
LAPDFIGEGLPLVGVEVSDDDLGALGSKLASTGGADARGCAGNDG